MAAWSRPQSVCGGVWRSGQRPRSGGLDKGRWPVRWSGGAGNALARPREPAEGHREGSLVKSTITARSIQGNRIQCVRVRTQAQAQDRVHSRACSGRLVRSARGRPCVRSRVQARVRVRFGSTLAFALAVAPGQAEHPAAIRQDTPDSKEAWARSGAWPPRAQTGKARYLSALQ
jgi:hypothetical protein